MQRTITLLLKEVLTSSPKKTVREMVKAIKNHDTLDYSEHFWASLLRQALLRDFIHKERILEKCICLNQGLILWIILTK